MTDNLAVVGGLYQAFSKKDETGLREVLHSDVELV